MISIIPKPVSIQTFNGNFSFSTNVRMLLNGNMSAYATAINFTDRINNATGVNLKIDDHISNDPDICYISLEISDTAQWCETEGYHLIVEKKKITIVAAENAGLFYGIQTLCQLMPREFEVKGALMLSRIKIQCIRIDDKPRFKWRGMNLDCGRHFMTKDFIKRYIDLLSYHKMNVFHWHLTEDQGWRIEIKKYPLLTKIGAYRVEDDGSIYGGYYTQEDIREIVAYAADRFVTVVPEIEMPGHSVAALASYPRFSCTGGPFLVEKRWGVFKDIYCAGDDSTFLFIQDVLTEVMELFPSKYIHIGGDEAPKYRWQNCPKCQARMKAEGLKDCMELQSYFIQRIERFLNAHGRLLIGWDEILEGGLAPSATVQSWQGFDGAYAAATQDHDAIVSPTSHCYFDADVSSTSLEKVYSFNPIPDGLTPDQQRHIIGGECCMWTERTPQEMVDSKVFPRICALAEVLWTPLVNRNYADFKVRMADHYIRLAALGVIYGYEKEAVVIHVQYIPQKAVFRVTLEAGQPDVELHYTLDGSLPGKKSPRYARPFDIDRTAELQVVPFRRSGGNLQLITRRLAKHLAIADQYTLTYPYSLSYLGGADRALTDGLRGTDNFRDNLWQGFLGTDFEAIVDLGQISEIQNVSVGFLQSTLSWIFYPTSVQVFISSDGKEWTFAGEKINAVPQTDAATSTMDFIVNFKKANARFIKIHAASIHKCPDWHPGAGGETWLFVDEIVVE